MQKLFYDTRFLDATVRERYALSEELMMENAAAALEQAVLREQGDAVLILCGSGNNGADGYALARRLSGEKDVCIISFGSPKSPLCKTQAKRCKKLGISIVPCGQKLKKKKASTAGRTVADAVGSGVPRWESTAGMPGGTIVGAGAACAPYESVFASGDGSMSALVSAATVIVDCIFGSGFHGEIPEEAAQVLTLVNQAAGAGKIACDVPTGLAADGRAAPGTFRALCTVTMGALKCCLYSDEAKDVTGTVVCANLGVSRTGFENAGFREDGEFWAVAEGARVGRSGLDGEVRGIGLVAAAGELREKMAAVSPKALLLDAGDLNLPVRQSNLVNKGTYGHAAIVSGEKCGAACIAADAALQFGSGLVTLVHLDSGVDKKELPSIPAAIMTGAAFPSNTTAVALGMGLGRTTNEEAVPYFTWLSSHSDIPVVLDADVCYSPALPAFLKERSALLQEDSSRGSIVLTPHPKEFQSLLSVCGLGSYPVEDCVARRLELVDRFCRSFPGTVLLVKGANPVIGTFAAGKIHLFINPHGTPALAKAGSGDVLSGLIASLLAQGRGALDAAVNASLAHALASQKVKQNFSLTPSLLIQNIGELS